MADHAHPSSASHGYHGHASGAGSGGAHGSADHVAPCATRCAACASIRQVIASRRARWDDLPFLLRRLPHEVRRRPRRAISAAVWRRRRRAGRATIYTCPMHPEVRQVGPGSCPICGMALEPETVVGRGRPEPRARRHDPALLGRPRADRARRSCSRWAAISPACTDVARPADLELAAARAGDAGRALGRLAVLRARLGVALSAATSTCSR